MFTTMFKISASTLKMLKQFPGLFTNRWAINCMVLMTIEQVIEASSSIWLVLMTERITTGKGFFIYLFLYLGALLGPYIPRCFASISKIHWKQEAQRSFINAFVDTNRNQIGEWSNKGLREEKLSILTTEGPNTIHAFIDYFYDLSIYVLSVILNVFALTIVVDPLFAPAYALSLVVVIAVMNAKRRAQRKFTQKALTARIGLYQSLLGAWDNVLLGNFYNFQLWQGKTTERLKRCMQKNVELERFDQILAITVAVITAIPSLLVVVYYAYVNQGNIEKLTSFAVTLYLLFMILSYTYQTLSLVFRWTMHRSKLNSIYKSIQPLKYCPISMEKKIKWPKLNVTSALGSTIAPLDHMSMPGPMSLASYQDLMSQVTSSGRLTLRGENGCGKSTLLMLVKNALNDKAFFLPTQNQQLSFLSETNKYSTGESLKNRLIEILENVDVDVLLLDEWDANLDKENQELLSALIDEIATKKCVIEVRHR